MGKLEFFDAREARRSLLIAQGRSTLFDFVAEKISGLKIATRECKTREKKVKEGKINHSQRGAGSLIKV